MLADLPVDDGLRVFASDLHEHDVARLSLGEGCGLTVAAAEQQIPFPMTRNRPIFNRGRTLAD